MKQQYEHLHNRSGISQCQGINRNKERCKSDVTHQLGQKGYCVKHFEKAVKVKK